MEHVVRVAPEPIVRGALEIHAVPAGTDNLVWLVVCRQTGAAAVVDGPSAGEVTRYARERGITIGAVWNTHTHGDHVGINREWLASGELPPRVYGGVPEVPGLTDLVGEGSTVALGAHTAQVWRTEGHLHGHVSYVLPGVVFCGDTLFAGGCGRVFGGTHQQLFDSLMRLAELPGDTLVCCAHEYTRDNLRFAWSVEPDNQALAERITRVWATLDEGRTAVPSTIDQERATNPFLRPGAPTLVAAVDPAARGTPAAVFAALRTLKDQGAYRALPDPRAA